jgi:predicted porin
VVAGKSTSLTLLGSNGSVGSRWGFRGTEDLGGGLKANFDLESGFDASTGAAQNSFAFFDRQAWVGLSSDGYGEVRFGRQQTPFFYFNGNLDAFGGATYGSGYNNFSQWQSRINNDISYISPKIANTQVELHYSVGGIAGNFAGNAAYQAALSTQQGPVYFAAAYFRASSNANTNHVQQIMAGANYDWGRGKVYLGFFRSNDVISASTGNALSNPAGKYDPTLGVVANTAGNYHNTYSLSADYRITPAFKVGAGYTLMRDTSSLGNNGKEFALIATYALSKRTVLYSTAARLINSNTAQFKIADAAITTGAFLTPGPGQSETAVQIGMRHSF